MQFNNLIYTVILIALSSCSNNKQTDGVKTAQVIKPLYETDPVEFDTDDPAIWVNPNDPSKSMVIGTDKDSNGALYAFDLKGHIIPGKIIKNLQRPDNVDIAYGLLLNGKKVDIAVVTERITHKLRIFELPSFSPLDNGGIEMFIGETGDLYRDLMGIAMYKNPKEEVFAMVGRKSGPSGSYIWQYQLEDAGDGKVKATLVRKFGAYSGKKEIESIAVDNELGFIYYSDEQFGVRKYYADPKMGNKEVALFAISGFTSDHEGISIYKTSGKTGYILVSDQQANQFQVFSREVENGKHIHLMNIKTSTNFSDGSDVVSIPLNADFKHGLFVAMSDNKTFQYYRWEDLAGNILDVN
ncbi:MAG: phytase [Pelobium sp.]